MTSNWSDTEFSNWTTVSYPVLDPQLEDIVEQMEYNETLTLSDDDNEDDMAVRHDLSQAQFIIVYVITTFASLLSVIGSSLIILSVIRRHKKQQLQSNTNFQFLLGLSICDILFSITVFLGSFTMPTDQVTHPYSFAAGNDTTCSVSAFFTIVFSTGGAFYNCWISLHFWRTVQPQRRQQKDDWLRIGCHSSAAVISLLLGVAGFVVDGYGPHPFLEVCYTVGTLGKIIGQLKTLITALLTLAATYFTASLVRTVRISIKKSERYTNRAMSIQSGQSCTAPDGKNLMEGSNTTKTTYMMGASHTTNMNQNMNNGTSTGESGALIGMTNPTNEDNSNSNSNQQDSDDLGNSSLPAQQRINANLGGSSNQRPATFIRRNISDAAGRGIFRGSLIAHSLSASTNTKKEKSNSKDKEVATQACWYYAAYLNTVLVPAVAIAVMNTTDADENPGKPQYFVFLLCVVICVPVQGALNFAVFIRPRVKSWREYYEREQEELEARHARGNNNNLPTIKDDSDKSVGIMPPFFTILKKAILEEVPKKRKRRIMPVSGASNVSAISAPSGMSSRFSASRVSFAIPSSAELHPGESMTAECPALIPGPPESTASEPVVASINVVEGGVAAKPQLLSPSSSAQAESLSAMEFLPAQFTEACQPTERGRG